MLRIRKSKMILIVNRMYLKKRLDFSFFFFKFVSNKLNTRFQALIMIDDDDETGDDDGWQILKPGVVLFETTIGLVKTIILQFVVEKERKTFDFLFLH